MVITHQNTSIRFCSRYDPHPFLSRRPQRLKGGCRPSFRPSRYRAATRNDAGIRPRLEAELRGPGIGALRAHPERSAAMNRSGAFRTQHCNEPIRRMGPRTTGAPSSRRPIPAWLKEPPSSPSSAVRPRPLLKQFAVSLHAKRPILPSCLPAVVPLQSQRREPAPQRTLFLSRVPQRREGECRLSFRPSRYRAATRNDAGIRPRLDAEPRGPGLARSGRSATRHRSGAWGRGRRELLQVAARYRLG